MIKHKVDNSEADEDDYNEDDAEANWDPDINEDGSGHSQGSIGS